MADIVIPSAPEGEPAKEKLEALVAALKSRCSAANPNLEVVEEVHSGLLGVVRTIAVHFPNGRVKRRISVSTGRAIERLMAQPFTGIVFLGEYEAICDYSSDYIEAYIRSSRAAVGAQGPFSSIFGKNPDGTPKTSLELRSPNAQTGQMITIGPISGLLKALVPNLEARERFAVSIRLTGFGVKTHDQALSLLERVALSIFLHIDLQLGVPLILAKSPAGLSRFFISRARDSFPIAFPSAEYDREPAMLYFYGRTTGGLPLLQFLAFYQVLEFYFPKFSLIEARRRASAILKTPGFDCHREADVVRLVNSLSRITGGKYGDERGQLKATIAEIVSDEELVEFYKQSEDVSEFFAKSKETTSVKIPLGPGEHDIRGITAERIYDIRCKIVHSKSDTDGESYILPFSRQAGHLFPDVALMSFLAQKALIHGSTAFKGAVSQ